MVENIPFMIDFIVLTIAFVIVWKGRLFLEMWIDHRERMQEKRLEELDKMIVLTGKQIEQEMLKRPIPKEEPYIPYQEFPPIQH